MALERPKFARPAAETKEAFLPLRSWEKMLAWASPSDPLAPPYFPPLVQEEEGFQHRQSVPSVSFRLARSSYHLLPRHRSQSSVAARVLVARSALAAAAAVSRPGPGRAGPAEEEPEEAPGTAADRPPSSRARAGGTPRPRCLPPPRPGGGTAAPSWQPSAGRSRRRPRAGPWWFPGRCKG